MIDFIWVQVFQRIASIKRIQSMNERGQKLFNTPPGEALVCLTFNISHMIEFTVYVQVTTSPSCAFPLHGRWPWITQSLLSSTSGSYIFFRFPACFSLIDERKPGFLDFSLVQHTVWKEDRGRSSWKKQQIESRLNIPTAEFYSSPAILNAQTCEWESSLCISVLHAIF